MAIKLKNNHKIRITIVILGLVALTIATFCFLPEISRRVQVNLAEWKEAETREPEIKTDLLKQIYKGSYVLCYEMALRQGVEKPSELYVEITDTRLSEEKKLMAQDLLQLVDDTIGSLSADFEEYRSQLDYAVLLDDGEYEKNTSQPLELVFDETEYRKYENQLLEYYSDYFVMEFDNNGILHMGSICAGTVSEDLLIKAFGQIDRENPIWENVEEYLVSGVDNKLKKPTNFTVAFGIPRSGAFQISMYGYEDGYSDYTRMMWMYQQAGAGILYVVMLALVTVLMFFATSKRVWRTEISMNRSGRWYVMEAAVVGVTCGCSMLYNFVWMVYLMDRDIDLSNLWNLLTQGGLEPLSTWVNLLEMAGAVLMLYTLWYLSVRFIRPVFSLGLKEYIRQYSLIYQIFPLLKRIWKRFWSGAKKVWQSLMDEVGHVDFGQKSVKTIVKLVAVNFVILSVISFLWFFGIGALLVYSVALFFFAKKYYDRIGQDYRTLLRGVNEIAEGNLDTEITEDIGVFEPFKGELVKIRTGFKKAVDEEVKSQHMKTELITNVSHDLKTPLTAITTYVELLKNEDITEEERRSYIEILEKKSLRLKVLIEDLFEVSKATSNNISLHPTEVDVVNLMKQVSIEHTDAYQAAGLELRWRVPEQKVILMLDNQKTYRIFENLFGNVQKYAMQGSRVYIDVETEAVAGAQEWSGKTGDTVRITIRNMSREELNFRADEITERFVRGDVSRNTEGSGLGLAIAKSFTEAQGGKFEIEVDGDLFKAVLQFKK